MPVREAIRDVQHAHAVTLDAIGTRWSIRSDYPLDTETITRVRERIDEFDRCYSRFRDDSYVCMVAGHPGQWPLPADAAPMFALYDRLDEITGGAVNPLVGSRMEFLGYDSSYRLRPAGAVTTQRTPRWTEHVVWGDGVLRTTPGVGVIDVGAIGKGYLIDLVGGVLRSAGHQDWLIDAGGDILASGRPRRIGLEHPYRLGEVIGVVTIQDEAICASGTARRAWGDGLHHIVDARNGMPVHDVSATWAVAGTAREADGLATALFFTEPAILETQWNLSWAMVRGKTLRYADTLRAEIFTAEEKGASHA